MGLFGNKKKISNGPASAPTKNNIPVSFNLQFSDIWENPELVLTNMAVSWVNKVGTVIPAFILAKFPYIQAVTLIMLLAERALKMEKYPPMHPYIIYTVAAVCLMAGVMISARIKVKFATMMYAGVLAYLAFNAYTNKQFNYSKHDRNRISSRHLGCMGVYLIWAFIKGGRQSKMTQRVGELCVAIYLLGTAYLINESYEDRRALFENIPGGHYARYFFTVMYGCAGLCFLSGYFLKDISMSMAFVLTLTTFLVDCKFSYWTYRGMAYWNQVRLVINNINLLAGFFMLMTHYEHMDKLAAIERAREEEEAAENQGEEEEYKGVWHAKDE